MSECSERAESNLGQGSPCRTLYVLQRMLFLCLAAVILFSRAVADDAHVWTVAHDGSGNSQTIAEVIEKAQPGAKITIRPGVYHESLVLKKPLQIVGEGERSRIVIQADDADCVMVNADRAVLRGLTLRCRAGEDAEFFAVDVAQGEVTIEDCDLSSNSLASVGVHGDGVTATVRNSWLRNSNDAGIFFYEGARGTVDNCEIFDNAGAGIAVQTKAKVTVRHCRIHHNDEEGVAVTKKADATIDTCDLFANGGMPVHNDQGSRAEVVNCRIPDQRLSSDTITANIDDNDQNVDPTLDQVILHFAQPMDTASWHLGKASKKYGRFPQLRGENPACFRDPNTFVIDVSLKPDTWYAVSLNAPGQMDFQSSEGVPLEQTVVYFRTAKASGETPPSELTGFDVGMRVLTFLQRPTQQNFLAAREAVIASKDYQAAKGNELDEIATLFNQEKYEETKTAIEKYLPQVFLSPRVHLIASMAIKNMPGDDRERRMGDNSAQKEHEYGRNLLNAIYKSGDGSKERPYLVLRIEDEYDLLAALSKEVDRQSLVQDGGKAYDVMKCKDGTTMWFDITSFFGRH